MESINFENIFFNNEEDLSHFLRISDRKKRKNLLREIFSENEIFLDKLFPYDKELSSIDISFLFLENIPIGLVDDLQEIIEVIFREAESNIKIKENLTIINNIRVFVLLKKKGLSVEFLSSSRILNSNLPLKTRIDLSLLLIYLDPNGKSFDWNENSLLLKYPYLIPAKMKFYSNEPLKVLKVFFSINKRPEEIVVEYIVNNSLHICLENLLIKDRKYKDFVFDLEPLINYHWSKEYVYNILKNQLFEKNSVLKTIKDYKNISKLAKKAYEEIMDNYDIIINDNEAILSIYEKYHLQNKNILYSLFDYWLSQIKFRTSSFFDDEFEKQIDDVFLKYFKIDILYYLLKKNIDYRITENTFSFYYESIPNKTIINVEPFMISYTSMANEKIEEVIAG